MTPISIGDAERPETMSHSLVPVDPGLRKLWKSDLPQVKDLLLRMDMETRRLRFGIYVHDDFLIDYAEQLFARDSVVYGAFPDGTLRAVGEVRGLHKTRLFHAEAAVSVEPEWQEHGIGSALFERLVTSAQNRGIVALHVHFLKENQLMRRITEQHESKIEFHSGEVEATVDPHWPTPMSLAGEVWQDTNAFVRSVLHLPP